MTRTAAVGLSLARAALAGALDQHNDGPISGGTSIGAIGTALSQSAAQTLTVGLPGILDRVEMYIYADGTPGFPLVLKVVPVAAGQPDDSTILPTASLTPAPTGLQWVSFNVAPSQLPVAPGQQLALILLSQQHLDRSEEHTSELQ